MVGSTISNHWMQFLARCFVFASDTDEECC
jgi:hypothetical protein